MEPITLSTYLTNGAKDIQTLWDALAVLVQIKGLKNPTSYCPNLFKAFEWAGGRKEGRKEGALALSLPLSLSQVSRRVTINGGGEKVT